LKTFTEYFSEILRTMSHKKRLPADAYTIGLVYAKPLEMTAITVMLDEEHASVPLAFGDKNEYTRLHREA
jgi:hypothetical protein